MKIQTYDVDKLEDETIVELSQINIRTKGLRMLLSEQEDGSVEIMTHTVKGWGDSAIITLSMGNVFNLNVSGNLPKRQPAQEPGEDGE